MKKWIVLVAMVFTLFPVIAMADGVLCFQKSSGIVKYSDSGICDKNWSPISLPAGTKGDKGDQGIPGIPGTFFDLSKLYTVTSHYAPAMCNNDDVSISCTVECSTHPDYPSPPYPFPFYGVPEEVINGAFGINFNAGELYAYEDNQPGTCVSKCIVPPGTMGFPQPNTGTYTPIIRVLCMPRN